MIKTMGRRRSALPSMSMKRLLKKKQGGRTAMGNFGMFFILALMAAVFLIPVVFMVNNAFKPLDELMRVPPLIMVRNPTTVNFSSVGSMFNTTLVPMWRYAFNTILIVSAGVFGQIVFATMAAFPLAKFDFAGDSIINRTIVVALMFSGAVTAVPLFLIMSWMGLIDTYFAVILPAFGSTLGLFLMRNFMAMGVPSSLIEAASIDGANEFLTLRKVVFPAVKPALITLFILSFQGMWAVTGGTTIYTEALKPLSAALQQIASGVSIMRMGESMAVSLIMFTIPVVLFVFMQTQILETMTSSGMKE